MLEINVDALILNIIFIESFKSKLNELTIFLS